MRTGEPATPFASTLSLPPSPVFLGGTYTAGPPKTWVLDFSAAITWMRPGAPPSDWSFKHGLVWVVGTAVSISAGQVRVTAAGFNGTETLCSYSPGTLDYETAGGSAVQAFVGLPL